jgi:fructokinase
VKKKPTCVGTGLVALDVILNGSPQTLPKISVGGSCGNVLSILGYLGWESTPIARLADNSATQELLSDFIRWHINTKFLKINNEGSTPIIIHRILKDKQGNPIHRFEFKDPETKAWLPQFKGITINFAQEIISQNLNADVFYFDRVNPGTVELAKYYRKKGTLVFFEPSSIKDERLFGECVGISNIVKFSSERISDFRKRFPKIKADLEIETLGKRGLAYRSKNNFQKNEWKMIDPSLISTIVDAAGAGDWCSAGIISKLGVPQCSSFQDWKITEIEDALNYGQVLGGINCCFDGARGIMYSLSKTQLDKYIKRWFLNNFTQKISYPFIEFHTNNIDISRQIKFSSLY